MSDARQIANHLETRRWAFDDENVRSVVAVGTPGWYAIFVESPFECVYVGVSKDDIGARLLRHLNSSHNADLDEAIEYEQSTMSFGVFPSESRNKRYLEDIEDDLIGIMRPTTNIQLND